MIIISKEFCKMKDAGYKFIEHTADVKVRSWGSNLEEAFSQAALGLMATISPNLEKIKHEVVREINVESEDKYALAIDFLTEFLYIFDVENLIFNEINVQSIELKNDNYELKALAKGERFDKHTHEIGTEVKAITYSFMNIEEKKERVTIEIVFDI
ncbi:MAG: archease [Promethearchaeota archaeon]|nr:MAG: archease [Candidatus Lokiarchaeota archaeon]